MYCIKEIKFPDGDCAFINLEKVSHVYFYKKDGGWCRVKIKFGRDDYLAKDVRGSFSELVELITMQLEAQESTICEYTP